MAKRSTTPAVVAIVGDEPFQKDKLIDRMLDVLLPPDVDRALALCVYDGAQPEDQGGPTLANVMDDLATLPFLSDRRVVVIREADKFISQHRDRLEQYVEKPSGSSTLILECRSLPKSTRLHKAIARTGGEVHECARLKGRAVSAFVTEEARSRKKRIGADAAQRLADLIGQDQGLLTSEIEKLALYVGDRPQITLEDVRALVGQSREEKIFAAMDLAGTGKLREALDLWHQVLATDPEAVFKVLGGIGFVLRRWLESQRLREGGTPLRAIAAKLMMWGREAQAERLLQRLPAARLEQLLADLAELDSQAKRGTRSIETGVEALLIRVAAPAA